MSDLLLDIEFEAHHWLHEQEKAGIIYTRDPAGIYAMLTNFGAHVAKVLNHRVNEVTSCVQSN